MRDEIGKDDWKVHHAALERWKNRALSEVAGQVSFGGTVIEVSTADALDFSFAFFIWAHSFKDWLLKSGAFTKAELEAILTQYTEWELTKDLANKTKHREITRNPTDPDWKAWTQLELNKAIKGEGGLEPYVFFKGEKISLKNCVEDV